MKIPQLSPPKTRFGQFLLLFCTQFISFFIIVANTRAYTRGNYFWTALTDTVYTAQGFTVGVMMVNHKETRSFWSGLGCTLGGTCGSLASIWVTKHLYGG